MTWNPFKKPEDDQHPVEDASAAARLTAGDDATDPMVDVSQVEEVATLLRDYNGARIERVTVSGAAGVSDEFLRLSIREAGSRTDAIRQLLLNAPERVTGFRDLLVSADSALAASLELPDTSLATACTQEDDPALWPRPLDLLHGLRELALLLAAARDNHGLGWSMPNSGQVGVIRERFELAGGLMRQRLVFSAWDQLSGEPGDPADLVILVASSLSLLREQAERHGFEYARWQLDGLLAKLNDLVLQPGLDYAAIADLAAQLEPRFEVAHCTGSGKVRDHNEDASLLMTLDQASNTGAQLTLAAVADGMGGHQSGEIASSLALDLLRQQLSMALLAPRSTPINPRRLAEQLAVIIPAIDRALTERAQLDPQLGGMGTTLVGFAQLSQLTTQSATGESRSGMRSAVVFHVGDSRAYLLTPTGPRLLTRDHSLVQDLLDSGTITAAEAFDHPQKNVITRCLGGGDSSSEPDVHEFTPGPGEVLLIASDGLTDMLRDAEIWRVIGETGGTDLEVVAHKLLAAANEAGGKDNITVLLIGCVL